jgi:hypothetical protein
MTSRMGLAINQATNDLHFTAGGDLVVVTDAEAVGQHARQRLSAFEGEWFLDKTVGVPWLSQILGKRYDPALAEAVTKACLLGTDGVTEITSFSVQFGRATRGLLIRSIDVLTDYDEEVSV